MLPHLFLASRISRDGFGKQVENFNYNFWHSKIECGYMAFDFTQVSWKFLPSVKSFEPKKNNPRAKAVSSAKFPFWLQMLVLSLMAQESSRLIDWLQYYFSCVPLEYWCHFIGIFLLFFKPFVFSRARPFQDLPLCIERKQNTVALRFLHL